MLNICTTCISWEIGSYNTQQCLHMNIRTFVTILSRKAQYNFPKMRGGGQRPFGTFPKTHPIWCSHPPLNKTASFFCDWGCCWWTSRWRRRRISRTSSSESESRLARPPPSPSHFTGQTGGSQVISNQL